MISILAYVAAFFAQYNGSNSPIPYIVAALFWESLYTSGLIAYYVAKRKYPFLP